MFIREQQLRAMRQAVARPRTPELRAQLRSGWPARVETMDDPQLDAAIDEAIARAQGYGISETRNVSAFVKLSFVVSPAFDRHPAAAAILGDADIPPDSKVDFLFMTMTPEQWQEASLFS